MHVCGDMERHVGTLLLLRMCCIFYSGVSDERRALWRADATPADVLPRAAFSRTFFAPVDLLAF